MKKWVINVIWYVYVNHIRERNLKKLNWALKELQYLELRRKKKKILSEFPDESLNILWTSCQNFNLNNSWKISSGENFRNGKFSKI